MYGFYSFLLYKAFVSSPSHPGLTIIIIIMVLRLIAYADRRTIQVQQYCSPTSLKCIITTTSSHEHIRLQLGWLLTPDAFTLSRFHSRTLVLLHLYLCFYNNTTPQDTPSPKTTPLCC